MQLFTLARGILEPLEEIRGGVEDNMETMKSVSNLVYLKEENYKYAVEAFFQAVSAQNGGEILKSDIKVTTEPPFLNFTGLNEETEEFADALFGFLNTFFTGKDKYQALVDGVQDIVERAQGLSATITDDIKNAGLPPMKIIKATKNFTANLNMLKQAGANAPRVPKIMIDGGMAFMEIVANIVQQYTNANEVGKKAAKEKLLSTPGKILLKFNEAERKTEEELLKAIYGDKWEKEKGKKEHKLKKKARKCKKQGRKVQDSKGSAPDGKKSEEHSPQRAQEGPAREIHPQEALSEEVAENNE